MPINSDFNSFQDTKLVKLRLEAFSFFHFSEWLGTKKNMSWRSSESPFSSNSAIVQMLLICHSQGWKSIFSLCFHWIQMLWLNKNSFKKVICITWTKKNKTTTTWRTSIKIKPLHLLILIAVWCSMLFGSWLFSHLKAYLHSPQSAGRKLVLIMSPVVYLPPSTRSLLKRGYHEAKAGSA